ncbi:transporter [Aeromonas jandaei]|nr:MATE family efflux transporter [Aeromonas jandaei]MBM0568711.1 transporter [Aeromonas jandaei]
MSLVLPSHLFVALSSWVSKAIVAGVQLISIRYLLYSLGEEHYAIFSLLSGLLIWCSISDFGIGSSLQNFISETRANKKKSDDYMKTGIIISFFSCLLFICVYILISKLVASFYLSSSSLIDINEKQKLFIIASVVFILVGVGNVSYKILFAEMVGWKANLYNAISYLFGFAAIWHLNYQGLPVSIDDALIALYGPVGLISFSYLIYRLFVAWKGKFRFDLAKKIIKRGFGFLVFSFLSILVLQADYIVISQKLSPSDIVKYTIIMKLFGLIFFIYSALLQALWPVCAEYRVKGEWVKLNKLIYKNILAGVLFICASACVLYICQKEVISLLSKDDNYVFDISTFIILALYFSIRVWADTFAMLLQSMNYLKILWFLVPVQVMLCGLLQWFLADYWGINGVLLGLALSFLLTVAWGLPFSYKYKSARSDSIE